MNDIVLIHTNCKVQRTLDGQVVFVMDQSNSPDSQADEDRILRLEELALLKRKLFIVSEQPFVICNSSDVFILTPVNENILNVFSIECSLYALYLRHPRLYSQNRGAVENVIRSQSQVYVKFMKLLLAPLFEGYYQLQWATSCPLGNHLILTHLMSHFLSTWTINHAKLESVHQTNHLTSQSSAIHSFPSQITQLTPQICKFLDDLLRHQPGQSAP